MKIALTVAAVYSGHHILNRCVKAWHGNFRLVNHFPISVRKLFHLLENLNSNELGHSRMLTLPKVIEVLIGLVNPREFTIIELTEIVARHKSGSLKMYHPEFLQDEPWHSKSDISGAKDVLGWGPTLELKKGIYKTIEHSRESLN